MIRRGFLALSLLASALVAPSRAANLLPGFAETIVVSGVPQVVDFDWDPDGVLWIAAKGGKIWRREGSTLTLVAELPVFAVGDSGIATLRVDPHYATSRRIWVHYTNANPWVNRLSHFTHVVQQPGGNHLLVDENVIVEHAEVSSAYNGGCLEFLPDDTLFVAMGYDGDAVSAQDLGHLRAKLLRLNHDGSAAPGNPFDGENGDRRVWSYGLREVFRCTLQPGTNRLFMADVGNLLWEEINIDVRGGNFGWAQSEGPAESDDHVSPFYSYPHQGVTASAIIGGAFIEAGNFPGDYVGDYIFGDFNLRKLYRMRLDAEGELLAVEPWATNVIGPVSIQLGPDGALYYASFQQGQIRRIGRVTGTATGGRVSGLEIAALGRGPGSVRPSRTSDGQLLLYWNSSCLPGDTDYAIYEGPLGKFTRAYPRVCSTAGLTEQTIQPSRGNRFYLIVPHDGHREGSLGTDSAGTERPVPAAFCYPQEVTACQAP